MLNLPRKISSKLLFSFYERRVSLQSKIIFKLFLILITFAFFLTTDQKAHAATIRQEINILDAPFTGLLSQDSSGKVQLDTTQYSGTPTYYFEIVYTMPSNDGVSITLRRNGTTTDDATIALAQNSNYVRSRTSFTPPAGQTTYVVHTTGDGMTTSDVVRAARIIVIQDTSTNSLTSTETQIEIGNNEVSRNNTSSSPLANPKYWTYTAANWNGTKTFYAETTWVTSATNFTLTITLQEDDGSFGTWSDIVTILSAQNGTTPTITRSASFTPTAGRHYRIASLQSSAAGGRNHSLYNAKIIVDQSDINTSQNGDASSNTSPQLYGGSGSNEQFGTYLAVGASGYSLQAVSLLLKKISSPTDNIYVELTDTSISNTTLATSDNVAASSVSTSATYIRFNFSTPYALSASTTYYFRVIRTGARDTTNYVASTADSANPQSRVYTKSSGSWSSATGGFIGIKLHSTVNPTLLEPQYLLINYVDSGVTGLQNYQQQWNASEWSGVSNVYKYSQDATNAADSSKLQDIDNSNADIPLAVATGSAQTIGGGFTMPTNTHQFDVNVINTTGMVTAGRVLVETTVFGPLDHYVVTIATPQTAGVCVTGTNTVTAKDASNNTLTNDASTVNMTNSGTGITFYTASNCSSSTTSYTLSAGVANIYYKTNKAQSFTITATKASSTETGTSSSITVNPGTHTRLVVTLPSQTFTAGTGNSGSVDTQTAGTQFTISGIRATDDYFNVITSYSGAKTLSYSGPAGSPTYTTSVSFTSGASTTTLLTTLTAAETTNITVTDGGSYGYASSSLVVNSAGAPGEKKMRGGLQIRGGAKIQ